MEGWKSKEIHSQANLDDKNENLAFTVTIKTTN